MSIKKLGNIHKCILIAQPLQSDYPSASIFNKIGTTTAINHCMSWLLDNGITQIFLFYSRSQALCEEQIKKSWGKLPELNIHGVFMKPQEMRNLGDVMREVQFRNIISEDFIIMYGDTFANFNLYNAINYHFKVKQDLKQANRNVVLTTIMQRENSSNKIHILNSSTNEILQMEKEQENFKLNGQKINLKKMNIDFRRDLSYRDIYICAVDVLKSFKEAFQYTSIPDFISGMLTSEVYDDKIVAYVLEGTELSYRTNYSHQYYAAYLHYISRHLYPYTIEHPKSRFNSYLPTPPENSTTIHQTMKLIASPYNKVIDRYASISSKASVSNSCYVGHRTIINNKVSVDRCIIGDNCIINENIKLSNCIILDGTEIQASYSNCLIETINDSRQIIPFSFKTKDTNLHNIFTDISPFENPSIASQGSQNGSNPQKQQKFEEEEKAFLEEVMILVEEDPHDEIVTQLVSVQKKANKALGELMRAILEAKQPEGIKGVELFVQKWGQVLLKLHQRQQTFLSSTLFACESIPRYNKAFHIFTQYFQYFDIINKHTIIEWYEKQSQLKPDSVTLTKCAAVIEKLKEAPDSEEEQEEDEDEQGEASEDN